LIFRKFPNLSKRRYSLRSVNLRSIGVAFRILFLLIFCTVHAQAQSYLLGADVLVDNKASYLATLKGLRVGIVANDASRLSTGQPLADALRAKSVFITAIFTPEHGLSARVAAGELIVSTIDSASKIPVYSLYGASKGPTAEQLKTVDVVVFDLQDVGCRFYTYISTLEYVMKSCSQHQKPLIVLDRPNPFLNAVDGPVLQDSLRSFVGMQPVPILYGMTMGEYAQMLIGEKWLQTPQLSLQVVPMRSFVRSLPITLRYNPSPNLRNGHAISLYPSLCLFEGTPISVGRGSDIPFEYIGGPYPNLGTDTLTPAALPGIGPTAQAMYAGQLLYGRRLTTEPQPNSINLEYLIEMYRRYPDKDHFFKPFFHKLAGTKMLASQIKSGLSASQIKKSWQADLDAFKTIRARYLLY
jgi:uncharacterized protein YbbC (DUF1343 family)